VSAGPTARGLAALGIAAVLLTPAAAAAYCRTAGCEGVVGARCVPETPSDCGIVLAWPQDCLSYSLQADGTRFADLARVRELVRLGFDQWEGADCGGGATPKLALKETELVACADRTFDQTGANANLIVFRDDDWPYSQRGVLALTTVTYGLDTGTIRDADMEINTADVTFTFDDAAPQYDFQSIVTHEAGHFLGLAHSQEEGATMVRDYQKGSVDLRSLAGDDVAGVCAVYPPGDPGTCDPTPEGGLVAECGSGGDGAEDGGEADGCSVGALGAARHPGPGAMIALLLATALAARQRARSAGRAT
jgi:hypothetical protein